MLSPRRNVFLSQRGERAAQQISRKIILEPALKPIHQALIRHVEARTTESVFRVTVAETDDVRSSGFPQKPKALAAPRAARSRSSRDAHALRITIAGAQR
jgi:hypothetical protein